MRTITSCLFSVVVASACGGGGARETAPTAVATHSRDPGPCALDTYAPAWVSPHFEDERVIKTTMRRLHGAEIYIPARPGLTAEWLRRELAGGSGAASDCPLDVTGAEIQIESRGAGFVVTIRAADADRAGEVLRRARSRTASSR